MSDSRTTHAQHGEASHDSIKTEPWLLRYWAIPVLGYVFLLCMLLLVMANETFGR